MRLRADARRAHGQTTATPRGPRLRLVSLASRPFALALGLLFTCSSASKEICGNAFDDDMNGKIDCADSACTTDPSCQSTDGGNFGPCAKCGQSCTKQQDCFGANLLDDRPLAECKNGRCQQLNEAVQLRIEYNTASWGGVSATALGAVTTRWISKTAADGSAVTCDTVKAAAPANNVPLQVEASGKFFTMGLDVTRVNLAGSIPNPLIVPFAYTGSGGDYLIYTEAWTGNVDSSTRLPTGTRRDAGCVVSGSEVAPVSPDQDCKADGGTTCRTLRIPLPGP